MKTSLAIVYHSGYGHTAYVAKAVAEGAERLPDVETLVLNVDTLDEAGWATLDDADAIIFGAPTYMGGISAPFKAFIDSASKRWFARAWENKIAAGFTNSGAYDGDKLSSLLQLAVAAMQHGMIWVGNSLMPTAGDAAVAGGQELNRMGSFFGLMTQSANSAPEEGIPEGDLETARLFGARVAEVTIQFTRNEALVANRHLL